MGLVHVSERAPCLWVLWAASRPSQLALILLLYLLGIGMAASGPPVAGEEAIVRAPGDLSDPATVVPLLLGATCLLLVSIAVHYANEAADVDTDALTERTPFSGGSGVLIDTGISSEYLLRWVAVTAVTGGVLVGFGFTQGHLRSGAIAVLGVGLAMGLAYSLPPFALVRRGIGEPINATLGGILVPLYGVWVASTPTLTTAIAVLPFTLIVGCNLLAVHWPDRHADRAVGKRTVVVRWPRQRIRATYAMLAIGALALGGVLWWGGVFPMPVALVHLAPIPFLVWGWRWLTVHRTPFPAVAAMVVLAIGTTVTWWWVALVSGG